MLQIIQPPGWPRPKGYSNGMTGSGQLLAVAGQVGWDETGHFHSELLYEQWNRALSNVLAVVQAAGGGASDIVLMIVIVTDLDEYRAQQTQIGVSWKAKMGRHYPTMALFQGALLEPAAKVEIVAWAILPKTE